MSEIPADHWKADFHNWRVFVPGWERQLREWLAKEPDPALRFTKWLARCLDGEHQGPTLVFIEQPYLEWAETVDKIIEAREKALREQIADEVRYHGQD